jgi:hypothetical protein
MSSSEVVRITEAIDKLTPADRARVLSYLLRRSRGAKLVPVDLSEFKGTIKLTIDPMEYQESIRSEWN